MKASMAKHKVLGFFIMQEWPLLQLWQLEALSGTGVFSPKDIFGYLFGEVDREMNLVISARVEEDLIQYQIAPSDDSV